MSASIGMIRTSVVVALLGTSLLAGCGGGGEELSLSPSAPVIGPNLPPVIEPPLSPDIDASRTADVSQLDAVLGRCGVDRFEDFGATELNSGSFSAEFDGFSQVVGYLASGDYFDKSVRMDVAIPETDFRMDSLNHGHATHRMGVAMNGPFLVKGFACVKGTGRVTVVEGRTEVNWFSDALSRLPVDRLQGIPVAGLEFIGNFVPGNPKVYFTLDARVVSRPDSMSLCQLRGAEAWECEPASHSSDGVSYTFSLPVGGHGVFVLTEARQADD